MSRTCGFLSIAILGTADLESHRGDGGEGIHKKSEALKRLFTNMEYGIYHFEINEPEKNQLQPRHRHYLRRQNS